MKKDYGLLGYNPYGLLEPGNIDIYKRPMMPNGEGYSTVRSMSENFGGPEVLMPTIGQQGQDWTPEQAIQNYLLTGQHLGTFVSPRMADAYAKALHEQQSNWYSGDPVGLLMSRGLLK